MPRTKKNSTTVPKKKTTTKASGAKRKRQPKKTPKVKPVEEDGPEPMDTSNDDVPETPIIKLPVKPKRPTTAYTYYMKAIRASVKADNPEESFGAISKKVGAQWRAMEAGSKKRKPYDDDAAIDRERYNGEKEVYEKTRLKKPLSGFHLFRKDAEPIIKENFVDIDFGGISKKVSEMWKDCSVEDKQPYLDRAAQAKVEYERRRKELGLDKVQPGSQVDAAAMKALNKEKPTKVRSAYIFYGIHCREQWKKKKSPNAQLKFTDGSKKISQMWGKLSDKAKGPYNKKSATDRVRYTAAIAEWNEKLAKLTGPTGKKRRKKRQKIEGEPKRPVSTYILYSQEVRKSVTKDHPDYKSKEIVSEIAKQWREMPDSKKKKYKDIYDRNKAQFVKDLGAFKTANPDKYPQKSA